MMGGDHQGIRDSVFGSRAAALRLARKYMTDFRQVLPLWQEMELATSGPKEPVAQIPGDIPVEVVPLDDPELHVF